jgi:hypothetical protein
LKFVVHIGRPVRGPTSKRSPSPPDLSTPGFVLPAGKYHYGACAIVGQRPPGQVNSVGTTLYSSIQSLRSRRIRLIVDVHLLILVAVPIGCGSHVPTKYCPPPPDAPRYARAPRRRQRYTPDQIGVVSELLCVCPPNIVAPESKRVRGAKQDHFTKHPPSVSTRPRRFRAYVYPSDIAARDLDSLR